MPEVEDLLASSNRYWQQALDYLEAKNLEKASEMAWGSVATRVKALALAKTGKEIRTHKGIRDYVRLISSQVGDKSLYVVFRKAEGLHSNFYEASLNAEDIREDILQVQDLILKIEKLLTA